MVLHVANRAEIRTNLGVMNPTLEAVTVRFTLLGIDGQPFLQSDPLIVPPRSMQQWSMSQMFGGLYAQEGAILVETTVPVFTWGSVIDNYSGDAIFVRGIAPQ